MAMMAPVLRWSDSVGLRMMSTVTSLQPHLPKSLQELSPDLLLAILTSFAFIVFLGIASTALRKTPGSTKPIALSSASLSKRSKAKETPKVVLIGPSNTGKTSLFSALAFYSVPSVHPSQRGSESVITVTSATVNELQVVRERKVLLIDTPGHPRIKDRIIEDSIKDADIIAFCVDAKDALRGGASAGQAKDSSIIEAVDHLHTALTLLVKSRRNEKTRPPTLLLLFTRSDLSPHLNNVSLSLISEEDTKRRSILLSRAQATIESELSKRRAGMGLNAKKSAKVGGMAKVEGGKSGDGIWTTIKGLLGLQTTSAKGDEEEEDDELVEDYIASSASDQSSVTSSQVSLSKLNANVVYQGKAQYAFAALGKERGWADRDFEGLQQFKQIILEV